MSAFQRFQPVSIIRANSRRKFQLSTFQRLICDVRPLASDFCFPDFCFGALHLCRGWTQAITLTDWAAS
jgi:hypothetical protein